MATTKTLSEKLAEIEKANVEKDSTELKKPAPSSTIYMQRSGTKDISLKFTIGGGYKTKKRVSRNPKPIFSNKVTEMSFDDKSVNTSSVDRKSELIAASRGVVNITRDAIFHNTETKDTQARSRHVLGMHLMGGAGTEAVGNSIKKLEELNILQAAEDVFGQWKPKLPDKGKWKGGLN